jgi:hypothetical protein
VWSNGDYCHIDFNNNDTFYVLFMGEIRMKCIGGPYDGKEVELEPKVRSWSIPINMLSSVWYSDNIPLDQIPQVTYFTYEKLMIQGEAKTFTVLAPSKSDINEILQKLIDGYGKPLEKP